MNPANHYLIGKLVYGHICGKYGIKLDKNSFLWGNISPDFSIELTKKPHYSRFYLSAVQNSVFSMLKENEASAEKSDISLSYALGVICHFYADFFCRAHLSDFPKNIIKHVLYEKKLYKCCRDNFSTLCRIDFANKACGFYSGDNPNEFYRRFLNTIDSKDNMLTELTRAVTACCWVAGLVAQKACRSELYADYSCHSLAV